LPLSLREEEEGAQTRSQSQYETVLCGGFSIRDDGLDHRVGHPSCLWTKQKHLSNGAFEDSDGHPVWPKGADAQSMYNNTV